MKAETILLLCITSVSANEKPGADAWPAGSYCILQGDSGVCPQGFQFNKVRLSVPKDYEPSVSHLIKKLMPFKEILINLTREPYRCRVRVLRPLIASKINEKLLEQPNKFVAVQLFV